MGTRHLIQVIYHNNIVVNQYGRLDGSPRTAGIGVLTFIQTFLRNSESFDHFIHQIKRCKFVTPEYQIKHIEPVLNSIGVSDNLLFTSLQYKQYVHQFPQFSWKLSYDILEWIFNHYGNDTLWLESHKRDILIEWTYIIDLDRKELIVDGYSYAEYPFDELPLTSNFIDQLDNESDHELDQELAKEWALRISSDDESTPKEEVIIDIRL